MPDHPTSAATLLKLKKVFVRNEDQLQESGAPLSEDVVAQTFAIEYAGDLRFCHGPNHWYRWDGTRWKRETTRLAYHYCRTLARRMARAAGNDRQRITLGRAAFASGVERFARSDRVFAITPDLFDRDPWLLGTPGGVVDLRTGELSQASRDDYITKQTMVAPAERGAECPLWHQFLDEVTCGDSELRRFLLQFFGYALTGDVREECVLFLFGLGANGKGTLIRMIARIMDDYAVAADMATFTASRSDRHPTELAKLAGARLVTASETEQGRTWAWSRIKELTGNEGRQSARFMRKDFFEFDPTAKLVFTGNHKPRLPSTNQATARRMRLMPFRFVARDPDDTLKMRLESEAPAILRCLIDACLDWQANGLQRAQREVEATNEYLADQDLFAQWIDAACTINMNATATRDALFESWTAFTTANGEEAGTSRELAERLRSAGCQDIKHVPGYHGKRGFRGIALKEIQGTPTNG